jgi:hypothetical protein
MESLSSSPQSCNTSVSQVDSILKHKIAAALALVLIPLSASTPEKSWTEPSVKIWWTSDQEFLEGAGERANSDGTINLKKGEFKIINPDDLQGEIKEPLPPGLKQVGHLFEI